MGDVTPIYNLDRPAGARKFLREVRFGKDGSNIDVLILDDGRKMTIDEASDKEVVHCAKQLAESLGMKGRWTNKIR